LTARESERLHQSLASHAKTRKLGSAGGILRFKSGQKFSESNSNRKQGKASNEQKKHNCSSSYQSVKHSVGQLRLQRMSSTRTSDICGTTST
jgi:hypothetical protein